MTTRTASWLLVLILLPALARAGVVEAPVPELVGLYTVGMSTRTGVVHLPSAPIAVHSASFRLEGVSSPGLMLCGGRSPQYTTVGYDLAAFMPDGTGYFFWSAKAATPAVPGSFEWTQDFKFGTTWDFLLDGETTMDLEGLTFTTGDCWYAAPYPSVTVTAAVLIVDGEFSVPARNGTWGLIKGLYR